MLWLELTALVIIGCFSFVLLFGAPYLPSLTKSSQSALDMLNLKPGQTMLELGCGDGKVLRMAARRGINCVGYELNPILALVAWLGTRHYRDKIKIIWGDYWQKPWPPAEGIYGFILPRYMAKLDNKITQQANKPVRLVSFAFAIPARAHDATRDGAYLYNYK